MLITYECVFLTVISEDPLQFSKNWNESLKNYDLICSPIQGDSSMWSDGLLWQLTREISQEYGQEMEKLAYKLMELIALSLGLPADRFHGFFKDQTSFIRLNHYPPCPTPELALGVGRHKDGGALTILAQDDVGGLEVKRKTDGEWVRVKPTPDAYIINVGDIIQVTLSNIQINSAKYKSFIFLLIAKLDFKYQLL